MLLLGVGWRPAGLYSDIPHLYGRDALWRHPLPSPVNPRARALYAASLGVRVTV